MPAGQPTKYNEKIANKICWRISSGESLNAICKDFDGLCRATVYNWLADPKNKEFLDKYTQARERQAETFIDQCTDIADDSENDTITLVNKDGEEYEKVNHDHINRSRLRVETRIKLAGLMAPKKYGVKRDINLNVTDEDGVLKALIEGRKRAAGGEKD